MSLGNVLSPRVNERHFRRALQLLRTASQIQGYSLSRYLQQYVLKRIFVGATLTSFQVLGRLRSTS